MSAQRADSRVPATDVDHVWSNIRLLLPAGAIGSACQLGGTRLGPHLGGIADRAVVVAPEARSGPGWSGVVAAPDAVPLPDESFDLVVIDDLGRRGPAAERILREARRLARPSAVVVVGTSSRLSGWKLGVAAGSGRRSRYVALPGPRRPAVLVEARAPQAERYFLRHVAFPYRAPGRRDARARLAQTRNRMALAAPPRLALGAVSGRIAIVPGEAAPPSILEELGSFLRSSWRSLGLPGVAPLRFSTLIVGHRKTPSAVVSAILLSGPVPLVAKMPRYGGSSEALRREAANLEALPPSGLIRDTVPRSLGLHVIGDAEVLVQTGVRGRHLIAETGARRLGPRMLRSQFDLMFAWSRELQEATGRWVALDDDLIGSTLVPLAEAGVSALDGDESVARLLDQAIDRARALRGTPIRLAVAHGDFWAGNVLVEDGRISGVVDWERAGFDELPIWDPVKAVMDAAYHLDRYRSPRRRGPASLPTWGDLGPWRDIADPRRGIGFREVVAGGSWLSNVAREALTEAFIGVGIPIGWLPVAFPFHLVREFVHADASARSVRGWGSVLRAMARHPGTWADALAGERLGARSSSSDGRPAGARASAVAGEGIGHA
jgi:aminoglycoside phosphotransferase/SAM-dependent methyltransferase